MRAWIDWLSSVVNQARPEEDTRVERVEQEVAELQQGMTEIRRRTEALEAIHRLAGGGQ